MRAHVASLLLVLLPAVCTQAAKPWTLEACIQRAIEQNVSIRSAVITRQNQELQYQNAKNQRLPGVYGQVSQNISYGQYPNSLGYYSYGNSQTYAGSISASMTLFSGFQLTNTIKAQHFNLEAAIQDLKKAQESLAVQVANAYLQVLYNKEIYQIAIAQQQLSQNQLTRYENMAAAGKIPEGQVSEMKARLANDQLNATQAQNTLKLSLLDLSQLIEWEKWADFDVVTPDIEVETLPLPPDSAEMIYACAVTTKPAVKASEYRLKSSEKQLKTAEGAFYPTLSLGASYSNGFYGNSSSLSDQLNQNGRTSVGLSLQIPIFNRLSTSNAVKMAKLQKKSAELDLENSKKELYKELQQAWFNTKTALEKYYASKEALKQAEIAETFAEEKFNNGRATVYEYYEARMNTASSQSNLVQAKYNYLFSLKILDFYRDIPLSL